MRRLKERLYFWDLFDSGEITVDQVEANIMNYQNWGKLYAMYTDELCVWGLEDFFNPVIERLEKESLTEKDLPDFISMLKEDFEYFYDKISTRYQYYYEFSNIITILGLLKVRLIIPQLKHLTLYEPSTFFDNYYEGELEDCKWYRMSALEALYHIGAEEFLDIYTKALHDRLYSVVSTAVEILLRLDSLASRKVLKKFAYSPYDYEVNLDGLDFGIISDIPSKLHSFVFSDDDWLIEPLLFCDENQYYDAYDFDVVFTLSEVIAANSFLDYSQRFLDLTLMYQLYDGIPRLGKILFEDLNNRELLNQFIDFALNYTKINPQIEEKIDHLKNKYLANKE